MNSTPGFTEHAKGRLEHRLTGRARDQAHADLMEIFESRYKNPDYSTTGDVRLAILDPSLFIDQIPSVNPMTGEESDLWNQRSNDFGTWLGRAAGWGEHAFVDTVLVLLKAGIHPDDNGAFSFNGLLGFRQWLSNPRLLKIAIDFGASPQLNSPSGIEQDFLRLILNEFQSRILQAALAGGVQNLQNSLECANILLDAGATVKDPAYVPRTNGIKRGIHEVCAVNHFCGAMHDSQQLQFAEPLELLVRRLHARGMNLDMKTGIKDVAPIIEAIRNERWDMAKLLIELGADTTDAYITRAKGRIGFQVFSVIEEATRAGDPAMGAQMTEAIMRRRLVDIGIGKNADLDIVQSCTTPRRRKMVI